MRQTLEVMVVSGVTKLVLTGAPINLGKSILLPYAS